MNPYFLPLVIFTISFSIFLGNPLFTLAMATNFSGISPMVAVVLDTQEEIFGWKFRQEWFPYVEKAKDIPQFLKNNPDLKPDFQNWAKIDQNATGIWALFYQKPPIFDSPIPSISYFTTSLRNFKSLSIMYFARGNVICNVTTSKFNESFPMDESSDEEFSFKELSTTLVEGVSGEKDFQLDFEFPEEDGFLLIDKIIADENTPSPTPGTSTTRKRVFPSTITPIPDDSTAGPGNGRISFHTSCYFLVGVTFLLTRLLKLH